MKTALKIAAAFLFLTAAAPGASFADESPAAIVEKYIDVVVNGRQFDRIDEFVAEDLIQRNPNLLNGREPLRQFWTDFMGKNAEARFTVARVIAQGDLVVEHSLFQGSPGDRGIAVVDIYRVEDGLIVEHWDVVQPIPETFASGNHPVLDE
ncbi:MAG: nuclear transport factor 2 family protein [Pseudomonadota bacterium]